MLHVATVDTPEALESFRQLLSDYDASLPAHLRIPGAVVELSTLAERYGPPAGAMFIARDALEPVGCVAVKELRDDRSAVIKRLYVVPAARRTGAGRALMDSAIGFARDCGGPRVVLDTESELLPAAYRLYRSLGFVECEPYEPAEYPNATFMELRL